MLSEGLSLLCIRATPTLAGWDLQACPPLRTTQGRWLYMQVPRLHTELPTRSPPEAPVTLILTKLCARRLPRTACGMLSVRTYGSQGGSSWLLVQCAGAQSWALCSAPSRLTPSHSRPQWGGVEMTLSHPHVLESMLTKPAGVRNSPARAVGVGLGPPGLISRVKRRSVLWNGESLQVSACF